MKRSTKTQVNKGFRARRTRAKIAGTATRPRLSVHRSNKMLSAQLIDDVAAKTLVSGSLKEVAAPAKAPEGTTFTAQTARAFALGQMLAEKAKKAGISSVVFDRGSYAYHGRIKALADGAREGGLTF